MFQKTFLTRDSVLENIRMGSSASLEEVRAAAKEAQIDDFIMSLPDGYDTKVGSFGSRFSGGEKQRIAIARAILKNAPILILDEATSASDPENQMEIDKAIQNLCKGKTVIVVAHRLSALKLCDRVAVVENHTITSVGTHEEVRRKNAYYRKAWEDYEKARTSPIGWKGARAMREYKVNGSIGAEEGGLGHEVLKKNRNFYIGVAGTVLEGMLSGSLFMLLYAVMQFLWSGQFDMDQALVLTGVIAGIFLLRILIYSYGYTKAQIGGAEVSRNIRLFMGGPSQTHPVIPGLPRGRPATTSTLSPATSTTMKRS